MAAERGLPGERLKLVLRGKTLLDRKGDGIEDVVVRLDDGGMAIDLFTSICCNGDQGGSFLMQKFSKQIL